MQYIVKKLVFFIPQCDAVATDIVHGFGNIEKVLEELGGNVFIDWVVLCQLQRNFH